MIRFLKTLVLEDTLLKLLSLFLATLIWFTVSSLRGDAVALRPPALNLRQITFFNVPVKVLSSASDVHDFQVDPQHVEVTVEGSASAVGQLKTEDIRAMVDLTGLEATGDVFKKIEITTPSGVTHVRIVPKEVKVIYPQRRS